MKALDPQFSEKLTTFVAGCQTKINEYWSDRGFTFAPPNQLSYEVGGRYVKLISSGQSSRSVYCFVDIRTGDVLKAATWKAPAKHARGNIFNDDNGLGTMTEHGAAYLK